MAKFTNMNEHLKISIVTLISTVFVVFICFFCFFNGHMDIPLGFLLGGSLASFIYLLHFLADLKDQGKEVVTFGIIVLVFRFLLFAGILILVAILQFKCHLYIFNIFSYCGGYLLSVLVHAILLIVSKERKKNDSR